MKPSGFSLIQHSTRVSYASLLSGIRDAIVRADRLFCTVGIILCLVSPGWAQLDGAGLTGAVTDPTGLVVPGVHVLAGQDATGLRRETVSSGQGIYDIPDLPVGVYTVSFSRKGFETVRFENVVQSLGQTRTLNVTLKTPGDKQQVEVLASPQSLDQTTNTLGTNIEVKQVKELPLDGRAGGPGEFGVITEPANTTPVGSGTPRQIQLALRLEF